MNKIKNENIKANTATAASSAIGAAIGVAVGSMASEEIHAAEVDDDPVVLVDPEHAPTVDPEPAVDPEPTVAPEPTVDPEPTIDPEPAIDPEPIVDPEPTPTSNPTGELQVLGIETINDENGNPMQAALVSVNNENVILIDTNNDNIMDVMVADANHDQQITENEVMDISSQNISLTDLQAAAQQAPANDPNILAQNNEPDYINDANVDSFMA